MRGETARATERSGGLAGGANDLVLDGRSEAVLHVRDTEHGGHERCGELRDVVHDEVRRPFPDEIDQVVCARLQLDPDEDNGEDERSDGPGKEETMQQALERVAQPARGMCPRPARRGTLRSLPPPLRRRQARPTRTPPHVPLQPGHARVATSADSAPPAACKSGVHASRKAIPIVPERPVSPGRGASGCAGRAASRRSTAAGDAGSARRGATPRR